MTYGTGESHGNIPRVDEARLRPDAILHQRSTGSTARELLQGGKGTRDLLMRTWFPDWNKMRSAVLFIEFVERHGCDENMALNFLAASVSVEGRSRKEFSQVATGIIAPQLWGVRGDGKRGGFHGTEPKEGAS